ncbi:MAG TPA: hypothetical protein VGN12_09110 [Pirellulales bacterium]|jgi:hypothetical protein
MRRLFVVIAGAAVVTCAWPLVGAVIFADNSKPFVAEISVSSVVTVFAIILLLWIWLTITAAHFVADIVTRRCSPPADRRCAPPPQD